MPSSSQPQVHAIRLGGSTSTNSPTAVHCPMATRYTPPGRGSSVAATPIQRTALTGSVKNSNTVSRLASIWTSRSTTSAWLVVPASTLLPFFGLRLVLELLQAESPEPLEDLFQFLHPFGTRAVEALGPFPPLAHETGLLEYAQVLGDRRPGHVEAGGDVASAALVIPDQREDLAPPRLRQCLDCGLHETYCKASLT